MDRARSGRRPTYGGGERGRSLRHLEAWCEALLKEERCEGQTAWCYCIEGARGCDTAASKGSCQIRTLQRDDRAVRGDAVKDLLEAGARAGGFQGEPPGGALGCLFLRHRSTNGYL